MGRIHCKPVRQGTCGVRLLMVSSALHSFLWLSMAAASHSHRIVTCLTGSKIYPRWGWERQGGCAKHWRNPSARIGGSLLARRTCGKHRWESRGGTSYSSYHDWWTDLPGENCVETDFYTRTFHPYPLPTQAGIAHP
jgi:hypothetical protein